MRSTKYQSQTPALIVCFVTVTVIFASSKPLIIFGKLNSLCFDNFQTRLDKEITKKKLFRMALLFITFHYFALLCILVHTYAYFVGICSLSNVHLSSSSIPSPLSSLILRLWLFSMFKVDSKILLS
jgi:hypothetical protein